MRPTTKRIAKYLFGTSDLNRAGIERTLRGLRTGEQRELYLGLGLAALAFLQRTAPRKELVYRKRLAEGSALVIHHRRRGEPKIEVRRPFCEGNFASTAQFRSQK